MKYLKIVNESLELVELKLREGVSVSEIAKQANYSQFHFHRLFVAVVGVPVGEYVRRRRLTEAARSLLNTETPLIEIAFDAGYESQESFSRAFKDWFGITPLRYRKADTPRISLYQMKIDLMNTENSEGEFDMELVVRELDGFDVVGLCKDYKMRKPNDIPELWMEFNRRFNEIEEADKNGVFFGVCTTSKQKEDEFRYIAAVRVAGSSGLPNGMIRESVPKNKYAVLTVMGVQNLPAAYKKALGE